MALAAGKASSIRLEIGNYGMQSRSVEEAIALGCAAVVTNYTLIDAAVLARIHGAGLRALVYTVNDPATAIRLEQLGIDGIVTDAVDRFSPASPLSS